MPAGKTLFLIPVLCILALCRPLPAAAQSAIGHALKEMLSGCPIDSSYRSLAAYCSAHGFTETPGRADGHYSDFSMRNLPTGWFTYPPDTMGMNSYVTYTHGPDGKNREMYAFTIYLLYKAGTKRNIKRGFNDIVSRFKKLAASAGPTPVKNKDMQVGEVVVFGITQPGSFPELTVQHNYRNSGHANDYITMVYTRPL
jgi:hypothetical protein